MHPKCDDAGENGEVLNIDVPGINMAGHTWEITLLVSRNHKPKYSNRFLHNYTNVDRDAIHWVTCSECKLCQRVR